MYSAACRESTVGRRKGCGQPYLTYLSYRRCFARLTAHNMKNNKHTASSTLHYSYSQRHAGSTRLLLLLLLSAHLHNVLEPWQVHELLLVAEERHAGSQTHAESHAREHHRHEQRVVVLNSSRFDPIRSDHTVKIAAEKQKSACYQNGGRGLCSMDKKLGSGQMPRHAGYLLVKASHGYKLRGEGEATAGTHRAPASTWLRPILFHTKPPCAHARINSLKLT